MCCVIDLKCCIANQFFEGISTTFYEVRWYDLRPLGACVRKVFHRFKYHIH